MRKSCARGVLYVPESKFNILYVSALTHDSASLVSFTVNGFVIKDAQSLKMMDMSEKQ